MAKTWQHLRGNANGRRPAYWQKPFHCDGCGKKHGANVERTQTLDGKVMCETAYLKHKVKKAVFGLSNYWLSKRYTHFFTDYLKTQTICFPPQLPSAYWAAANWAKCFAKRPPTGIFKPMY